jgi:predicted NAD/FAD-binding protein
VSRIAVVGGGIAGLAACWLLGRRHEVVLLERDERLGGHTHTHHLDTPDGPLALDTGFIVHNERTYPLLVRLFRELNVACLDTEMSFGVTCARTGFEYGTRNLNSLFADRRTLVSPRHYHLLLEILRFGRRARALLDSAPDGTLTLGAFLDREGFRGGVVDRYLLPLASAIWSASIATLRDFPALTLVRFFHQHGMLNALDHPTWRIVRGGSATYIPRLLESPRVEVVLKAGLKRVRRTDRGVQLDLAGRPPLEVDEVVFACHGDEVLPLLADPLPDEREVLSAFRTTRNETWLHTDARLLPRRPAARAAWNYLLDGDRSGAATVTYSLNRLQRLETAADYCVTLNPPRPIDPSRVLARMVYTHPLYTKDAIAAQARWAEVSGRHRIHYCGAYWYYGFHEDGLRSAVRVATRLGVSW